MISLAEQIANARAAAFDFFNMAAAYRERAEKSSGSKYWKIMLSLTADRLDAEGTEAVRTVRSLLRRSRRPAFSLFGFDRPLDLPKGGAPL